MKKHSLKCETRDVTGKRVKNLRREGRLPATIYGRDFTSVSVTVDTESFRRIFSLAGESGLVELTLGSAVHPVLISNVQMHPVTRKPLHAEFRRVDLKEKIKANVAVRVIGSSPAVESGEGLLLVNLQEVEVEALPAELPEVIEVDITPLAAVDSQITVKELTVTSGVRLITDPGQCVVRITPPAKIEVETPAPAAAGEAVPAEAAEAGQESEKTPAKEENPQAGE